MSEDESEEVLVSEEDGFVTTTLTTQLTLSLSAPSPTGDHGNDKYQIQYQDRCGRMLVATQHINQGDTILIDTPACIGPDNNSRPVCLVCCSRSNRRLNAKDTFPYSRLVQGNITTCATCEWPLCSDTCRDHVGPHIRECSMFKENSTRFELSEIETTCPSYNAIMVLRLLWLMENDEKSWNMIDLLMDHKEDSFKVSRNEEKVMNFIREYCRLTRFSEKLILRLIGIIDTNAYIIGQNRDKNVDIQGLFPIDSIINHSCNANAVCFANDDLKFVCRASVDILPGEEITTNYLYHQYHFYGNTYRASEMQDFWHFTCSCDRCGDPTEFGTHVDSIICDKCGQSRLCPSGHSTVHYSQSDWKCYNANCDNVKRGLEIADKLDTVWNDLQKSVGSPLAKQLTILEDLLPFFGGNHYYVMEVKRRILELIGSAEHPYEEINPGVLLTKVQYCEEHLKLLSILSPGLTENRAHVSFHHAEALYWSMKRGLLGCEAEEVISLIRDNLKVVIKTFGDYKLGSSEKERSQAAECLMKRLESEIY